MSYLRRKLHNLTHPLLGRVLMLHRVVGQRSDGENRELEVTPQFLEQTIIKYRQQGYQFVSIDEACDIISKGHTNTPFVCLTFDDGYQDNHDIAYPILKHHEVPFAVYVTTGFMDNRLPMWWYPNEQLGISTESLKVLDADSLCTIGAHTVSHPKLDTLSLGEQKKEIEQSVQELEFLLGHPIRHFSYPHGAYNADTLKIVNECHFISTLRAWGGSIRKDDATLLELPRIELKEP
ncbi:MAG: polysaccharide deacetylase family protein [Prevotella sp.]|nr:polysaccharide deacetylase family protein [Bacteroidales bacterium]MBP3842513.1 polysaccharide deacetylase family protein [Prevotella sp.]